MQLRLLAPEIEVVRLSWDDSTTGNDDGVIQAGENVQLLVELGNFGAAAANSISGQLVTASGNVSLVDDTNSWQNLALLQTSSGEGVFEIIEMDISGENWIRLDLSDDQGHSWQHWFELRSPLAASEPSASSTLDPNSIELYFSSPDQEHLYGYRVYRADEETGPFVEITDNVLIRNGFYQDTELASLTRYYYQVSVVDSSRVESLPTAIFSCSTAPPELDGGFPIGIGRELAGCMAVGDMRGDGTFVAGFGADFLYAIDSDGQELVDGDQDSQTLGPLAGPPPPDDRFTPSGVSMADFDGDGAMEIVGSSWDTYEVWIVKDDGSLLDGWPQQMSAQSWATPVIGDLDDDGDLEIVVNNVAGYTYVWHHDGTELLDGDSNPTTHGIFARRTGESYGRGTPSLFDLDGDGNLEIIFGTHYRDDITDNMVHALKIDGTEAAGWPINMGPAGYSVVGITIADMDLDGTHELIFPCDNDSLYIFQPDGSTYPGYPIQFTSNAANKDSITPSPGVADFDNDGDLEMVLAKILSEHGLYLYLMDHDATIRSGWPKFLPGLSECSPTIADINGDSSLDIVFGIGGGSDNDPNILYAFNMDGTDVQGFPITLQGAVRATPVITDFDRDGDVDILYAGFDMYLHVWDMPFPYDADLAPWNTFKGNMRRTGVYMEDHGTPVDGGIPGVAPTRLLMHPNVPNPFNPSTRIRFEVPGSKGMEVLTRLDIYDLAGRKVRTLVSQPLVPGMHEVIWNGMDGSGRNVASGVYFADLRAADSRASIKITLVK